jgi:DnaJ-class molecular chaperone
LIAHGNDEATAWASFEYAAGVTAKALAQVAPGGTTLSDVIAELNAADKKDGDGTGDESGSGHPDKRHTDAGRDDLDDSDRQQRASLDVDRSASANPSMPDLPVEDIAERRPCPTCDGKGTVEKLPDGKVLKPCETCGGQGVIASIRRKPGSRSR